MPFTLPALAYDVAALEPHIDAQTMTIHHGKHHAAYVTNANNALNDHSALQSLSAVELLSKISETPDSIRQALINNVGGHANHTLFWEIMTPGGASAPSGALADAITATLVGCGRVGACLLPQLPKPPRRLFGCVVERGQLGRGCQQLRSLITSIATERAGMTKVTSPLFFSA